MPTFYGLSESDKMRGLLDRARESKFQFVQNWRQTRWITSFLLFSCQKAVDVIVRQNSFQFVEGFHSRQNMRDNPSWLLVLRNRRCFVQENCPPILNYEASQGTISRENPWKVAFEMARLPTLMIWFSPSVISDFWVWELSLSCENCYHLENHSEYQTIKIDPPSRQFDVMLTWMLMILEIARFKFSRILIFCGWQSPERGVSLRSHQMKKKMNNCCTQWRKESSLW